MSKSVERTEIAVTSEIGRLREAIAHTPQLELERVSPHHFGRMLMDDTLDLKAAQEEHLELLQILSHAGVKIHQVYDLLQETIEALSLKERSFFADSISQLADGAALFRRNLHQLSPRKLTELSIAGEMYPGPLTRFLRQDLYSLSPLPNLMFVRDCGTVVNQGIILSAMSHSVRARESLLFEWIFRYHPRFRISKKSSRFPSMRPQQQETWLWLAEAEERKQRYLQSQGAAGLSHLRLEGANFQLRGAKNLKLGNQEWSAPQAKLTSNDIVLELSDWKIELGRHFSLEGGNVFVLSETTILIGCNARTSSHAIEVLARELLEQQSSIKTILVAILSPQKPAFFEAYLESGFALLQHEANHLECLIHHPMIEAGGASLSVVKLTLDRGDIQLHPLPDLLTALKQVDAFAGCDITFLACGNASRSDQLTCAMEDRIAQEREWHHQGVNVLSLAPGKLVSFRHNKRTTQLLKDHGYHVISAHKEDGCRGFLDWSRQEVAEWLEDTSRKTLITVRGEELSRACGGPRSLVLPLNRDAVAR